jgi:ketosteroid isomerase-like protein
MLKKKIVYAAGMLMAYAMMGTGAALAADASNMAATAATWEKEYNAGNLQAIVALYTADACRMPPNEKLARGSDAILANIKSGRDHGAAKIKITVMMSETGGGVGHAMGTYELMGSDGKTLEHGKWMNASKKTADGWRVQCDIWNSDAPAPIPAEKAK